MGTSVTQIALPLTAAVTVGASTFQMGLLASLGYLPWLVIGLPAGSWIDRSSLRRVLVVTDLLRFLLLAVVPVSVWLGVLTFGTLAGVVLCTGVCTVFAESAATAVLPRLLDEDLLVEGNSLVRLSHSVSFVAGPGLGGWLVGLLTAPVALIADSASYLASALFVRRLPADARPEPDGGRPPLRKDLAEGLRTLFGNPYLRPAVLGTALLAMGNGLFGPVYILYLTRTLGVSAALVAVPFMAFGAGAVAGSLLAAPIGRRFGFGPSLIAAGAVNGVASFTIPLASHGPVPLIVVTAPWLLFGLIGPVYGSLMQTLVQCAAPEGMLGRIGATSNVLSWGLQAVAALGGGWLAGAIGLRAALLVSCGLYLASPLFLVFSRTRSLRKPQEAGPAGVSPALGAELPVG